MTGQQLADKQNYKQFQLLSSYGMSYTVDPVYMQQLYDFFIYNYILCGKTQIMPWLGAIPDALMPPRGRLKVLVHIYACMCAHASLLQSCM